MDTNDDVKTLQLDHTSLLTLFGANAKIGELFAQFEEGKISQEELLEQFPGLKPQLIQYGIEYDPDSDKCYTNTKPEPENWSSAMFFYTDDDGNTAATVRIKAHEDNHEVTSGETIESAAQQAAPDLVKLINREHDEVMQTVLMLYKAMKQMEADMEEAEGKSATEPANEMEESVLEGVDDEFTRARLLKEFRAGRKSKKGQH